jgi:general secretion pathway protein M
MRMSGHIDRLLARYPGAAAALYVAAVAALAAVSVLSMLDVLQRRQDLAATADTLSLLEARNPVRQHAAAATGGDAAVVTGSPFLEGPTVTVAGAALMERVVGAVARVGGTIVSSQVDLQGTEAKDGFIGVSVSCDIEQTSLQKLLYDLEAGMPFLFVDQMVAQTPEGAASAVGSRLHLLISVSGQWQGAKS